MSTQQKILVGFLFTLLSCLPLAAIVLNDLGRDLGAVAANEQTVMEQRASALQGRAIEAGADLYGRYCANCHGTHGEGVSPVAPALNRKDLLDGRRTSDVRWSGSIESFLQNAIAAGRPIQSRPDLYTAKMPTWGQAFEGPLRADQIDALVAFVENWRNQAPEVNAWTIVPAPARTPGAATAPGVQQTGLARVCQGLAAPYAGKKSPYKSDDKTILAQGKQIYDDRCAACHGAVGKGDGPAAAALSSKPANLADRNFMLTLPVDCHFYVISEGVKGTPMPPFKALGDDALWKVLVYTRAWSGVP